MRRQGLDTALLSSSQSSASFKTSRTHVGLRLAALRTTPGLCNLIASTADASKQIVRAPSPWRTCLWRSWTRRMITSRSKSSKELLSCRGSRPLILEHRLDRPSIHGSLASRLPPRSLRPSISTSRRSLRYPSLVHGCLAFQEACPTTRAPAPSDFRQ